MVIKYLAITNRCELNSSSKSVYVAARGDRNQKVQMLFSGKRIDRVVAKHKYNEYEQTHMQAVI